MYKEKQINCYNCGNSISELSPHELEKLEGLNFMCDCCGKLNKLGRTGMLRGMNKDRTIMIESIYELSKKNDYIAALNVTTNITGGNEK